MFWSQWYQTNPKKVQAVSDMPPSWYKKELQTFLGIIAFVRHLIKDFYNLTTSLTEIYGKNFKFECTLLRDHWFRLLKKKLYKALIMQYPIPGGTYKVEANALGLAFARVLKVKNLWENSCL